MSYPDIDDDDNETEISMDASLDASLREGFSKFKEAAAAEEATDAPAQADTGETAAAPGETAGKARGPDGKFVKADTSESVVTGDTSVAPEATAQPKRQAPTTWKQETRAKWDTLPPEIQDEVLKREGDMEQGWKELGGRTQQLRDWDAAVTPYMATINGLGVSPQTAVRDMLAADHTLRYGSPQQKMQLFNQIVQDYGISPDILAAAQNQEPQYQQPMGDPRVDQILGYIQAQERNNQAQADYAAKQELDKFKSMAPHLDTVREDMAVLLDTGRAKDLQEAYDKAVWGKAEIRQTLIAEQQKKQAEEAAKVASEARKAAAVNIPAKGRVAATTPAVSMDDDIRDMVQRSGFFSR